MDFTQRELQEIQAGLEERYWGTEPGGEYAKTLELLLAKVGSYIDELYAKEVK